MTHTTQDDAELREAFTKLMTDIKVLAYYADMDEDILANQAEMHLKSLAKLFQAREQQLLTELYGIYQNEPTIQKGYEALVAELFNRIEKYREGLHESHD